MRVVSFNIHHGTVGKKGPVDPERLGEVCAAFDADVIALQEVDQGTLRAKGRDLPALVAKGCGMAHTFGTSQRLMGGRYGNAILTRGTIGEVAVTRLPKVPASRFWQEQRTMLEATVDVDGQQLWVVCTHLAVKQWNNLPQLRHLLDHVGKLSGPTIVLGDFNRPTDAVESEANEAGFSLVHHGPTYPATDPNRTIDHVLMSPGIEVVAAEVHPTEMSDHAALVVDLTIPGR